MIRRSNFSRRIVSACSPCLLLLAACGTTSTPAPSATSSSSPTSSSAAAFSRGPQLGYVWSAISHNLYPLLGVPGSAHYGAPVLGSSYLTAAVAGPVTGSSDAAGITAWALLLDSTGTLTRLSLPTMNSTVVGTRFAADSVLSFAPSGAYAIVSSRTAGSAMLISGLPAQPQSEPLYVPPGASLSGAAVSDLGTVLAGWTPSGDSSVKVGTLSPAAASAIARIAAWGGAAFAPGAKAGSEQAVLADRAGSQVIRLTGIGGQTPAATAVPTVGLLQTPVAVAVSSDGRWGYAVDSAKQQVVRVDLSGSAAPMAMPCACHPSRLEPTGGNRWFEVADDVAAQPSWLLDARGTAPRIFFVPAAAAATGSASPAGAREKAR